MKISDFSTSIIPTWCPGCDNYLLMAGLKNSLIKAKIKTNNLVIVFDIGCAGNMADFVKCYGVHSLHGRCIPTAVGVKLANPKLTVFAIGGDGGVYGEGLNHLLASARADYDIKVIVANNFLYSLTTGQTSPTTKKDDMTKSTPYGNPNIPIDPVGITKAANRNVMAKRVNGASLKEIEDGIFCLLNHKGFGLIDIEQKCKTFGK